MIITDKHGNMIDTVEMVANICDCGKKALEVCDPEEGKEAQYHLRQFIKHMKKLGRYY